MSEAGAGDIARAVEEDDAVVLLDYVRTMGRLGFAPQAEAIAVAGGWAIFTGPGDPLNRTAGLGLAGPTRPADLERVEAFYRRLGSPARIEACDSTDPGLRAMLEARGYSLQHDLRVYALEIEPSAGPAATDPAPGVEVARVGPQDYERWARTVTHGFTGAEAGPEFERGLRLGRTACRRDGVLCYLARVEGEDAGGGALDASRTRGHLFSMVTLPVFRRRGVQSAVLRARVDAARTLGCAQVVVKVNADSDSERNVRRAGFRLAYSKVCMTLDNT